jgi:hypothetical protein
LGGRGSGPCPDGCGLFVLVVLVELVELDEPLGLGVGDRLGRGSSGGHQLLHR